MKYSDTIPYGATIPCEMKPWKKFPLNLYSIKSYRSYSFSWDTYAKAFPFGLYKYSDNFFCSSDALHIVCGYSPYRQSTNWTTLKRVTRELGFKIYKDFAGKEFFKIDDCEAILTQMASYRNVQGAYKENARNFLPIFKEKIAPLCTSDKTKEGDVLEYRLAHESKFVAAPNGTKIWLYNTKQGEVVKLVDIARALGYSAFNNDNSLLALVLKNHAFTVFKVKLVGTSGHSSYALSTSQVVPMLKSFARATLLTTQTNALLLAKMDEARMNAEQLIEIFVREGYGKPEDCASAEVVEKESVDSAEEEKQMEIKAKTTTVQNTPLFYGTDNLHAVTVPEIEDIGERANAIVKIFGVSMKDALRAATQLKAQEINRDLSPLLDLCN